MTRENPVCCVRSRADAMSEAAELVTAARQIEPGSNPVARRWSPPISGSFMMGSSDTRFPDDGEGPVRQVTVGEFAIACFAVSNLQFGDFVRATGYVTDAERYGWSFVFAAFLSEDTKREIGRWGAGTPRGVPVPPARWAQPGGPLGKPPDPRDPPLGL